LSITIAYKPIVQMKYFVLITITLTLCTPIFAQETIDLLTLSGRYGFPSSYDSIYDGKAKETGFMAGLVAPASISEKSIWYTSLNYFYFHVSDNEEMPKDIANPINLHGIILRTGLVHEFSEDKALQVFFSPRLMSDFQSIDGSHFQYGGMVLYEKLFNENLKMGFGAMYNQEFFGPYLVPLINLNWQINDHWSISGLLPVYAKIKYVINDRLNVGLSHFGLTTSYRLGEADYSGDYIERKSIDETLFARYRLVGNIYIEGRFGYALGRSYAQYAADQKVDFSLPLISFGDDRVQKNVSFHDGLIASLRLVYSIPIPSGKK
jgi:hypothetical protein